MKKIITLFFVLFSLTATTQAEEAFEVPENIGYYEYCYMSNQCEVPSKIQDIIVMNVSNIKHGLQAIY